MATDLIVIGHEAADLDVLGGAVTEFTEDQYIPMIQTDAPEYEGPYEATPAATAQTFPTTGKLMVREFTVNPIPSNWGLITWNGSTLTVS